MSSMPQCVSCHQVVADAREARAKRWSMGTSSADDDWYCESCDSERTPGVVEYCELKCELCRGPMDVDMPATCSHCNTLISQAIALCSAHMHGIVTGHRVLAQWFNRVPTIRGAYADPMFDGDIS